MAEIVPNLKLYIGSFVLREEILSFGVLFHVCFARRIARWICCFVREVYLLIT